MDIVNVTLPSTFDELVRFSKEYKKFVYDNWKNMKYNAYTESLNIFINKLGYLSQLNDTKSIIRFSIGIYCLRKIDGQAVSVFLKTLMKKLPINDGSASEFVSYIMSKFCKRSVQKDHTFVQNLVSLSLDWFSDASHKYKPKSALHLLKWIASETSFLLKTSSQQFVDSLVLGITIHPADIKYQCFEILKEFLKQDDRGHLLIPVAYKAEYNLKNSKSASVQQAAILILIIAVQCCPSVLQRNAKNLLQVTSNLLLSKDSFISAYSYHLMVELSALEPLYFKQHYISFITSSVFDKNKTNLSHLSLYIFKQFPDTLSQLGNSIIQTVRNLVNSSDVRLNKTGFQILTTYMNTMTSSFNSEITKIIHILTEITFNEVYAEASSKLYTENSILWESIKPSLMKRLLIEIKNKPVVCLRIIQGCPKFDRVHGDQLFSLVKEQLFSKDDDVRVEAPPALMKFIDNKHSKEFYDLTTLFLDRTLVEKNKKVLLSLIKVFEPPDLEALATPSSINTLSVLVNDNDREVRIATLKLLAQISHMNYPLVLPIFRKIFLNAIFTSSNIQSCIEESVLTEGIDIILDASVPILPIYIPVFLPFSTNFLNSRLSDETQIEGSFFKLTHFERKKINKVTVDIIKCLSKSCQIAPSLCQDKLKEVILLFFEFLDKYNNKKVILAILDALNSIVDTVGLCLFRNIPNMMESLFRFGAKFISKKIRARLFKFLGRIGPFMPIQNECLTGHIDPNKLVTTSDWILNRIVNALLQYFNDDVTSDIRLQILSLASECLLTYTKVDFSLLELCVNEMLKTIKLSPKDEIPKYFSILKQMMCRKNEWLKPFANDIAQLIIDFGDLCQHREILHHLPSVISCLRETLTPYLPHIVPILLEVMKSSNNSDDIEAVLISLSVISQFTSDYETILFVHISTIIYDRTKPPSTVLSALHVIKTVVKLGRWADHGNKIIFIIEYCFENFEDEKIKKSSQQLLFLVSNSSSFLQYNKKITYMKSKYGISEDVDALETEMEAEKEFSIQLPQQFNEKNFILAIRTCPSESLSKWKDWFSLFILFVIRYSPSVIISKVLKIAETSQKLALEVFPCAFISCWNVLGYDGKVYISEIFKECFNDPSTPMSVLSPILALLETMEQINDRILLSYYDIAIVSIRAKKFSFALYCITKEFNDNPNKKEVIDLAIQVLSYLSLDSDLRGFLSTVAIKPQMTPMLAETLCDWETAANLYTSSDDDLPGYVNAMVNLHKFSEVSNVFHRFENLSGIIKSKAAVPFARAFLYTKNYSSLEQVINFIPKNSLDNIIIHLIANALTGKNVDKLAEEGFKMLAETAGPLFIHGYSPLAPYIVLSEQIVEILEFTRNKTNIWEERADFSWKSVDLVQPIVVMRTHFLTGDFQLQEILRFLKVCRETSNWNIHRKFFQNHIPVSELYNPHVIFEKIFTFNTINNQSSIDDIDTLIGMLPKGELRDEAYYIKSLLLVRRCASQDVLYEALAACDESGTAQAQFIKSYIQIQLYNLKVKNRESYAVSAIKTYVSILKMRNRAFLPSIQQLASILFRSSKYPEIYEEIKNDISTLPSEVWLHVLPQVYAHLDSETEHTAKFARSVILDLLFENPHDTLFKLFYFYTKGDSEMVKTIFEQYKSKNRTILDGAYTFFLGFIEACFTRSEHWTDKLSRLFAILKAKDAKGVHELLSPLLDNSINPVSDDDKSFSVENNTILTQIRALINKLMTNPSKELFEKTYKVCREFYHHLRVINDKTSYIYVPSVSPRLAVARNIKFAVPGTYKSNRSLVTVNRVSRTLEVLQSKQHPKRLCIIGSNGEEYIYLLKGHEDLRLDQRTMQFFDLVNSLLQEQHPRIITYFVEPLTSNIGIIGWINGTDTMSSLIKDYRTKTQTQHDLEEVSMSNISIANIDSLRPIQRYEILKEVAGTTPDTVLSEIIWNNSYNSEEWLRRTLTFTQTTALMSITGYILGLGDRHPSNIILNRKTFAVIHIDLGDCFEVAKQRPQFPEYIPFRLTRFIIRVFGISGVKGTFHTTCSNTLLLMKRNREFLMTVLQIFVYSPISSPSELSHPNNTIDPREKLNHISDKLSPDSDKEDSTSDQVDNLIQLATDFYNLAHLYRGWSPLW